MTISHKPVDNALNPAWRSAAVHLITSISWNDALSGPDAENAITKMTNVTGYALRQLAPDSGVYYNEVSIASVHHQDSPSHTFPLCRVLIYSKGQCLGA
jgi:hypothetical protein